MFMLIFGESNIDDAIVLNVIPEFPPHLKGYFRVTFRICSEYWGQSKIDHVDTLLFDNDLPLYARVSEDVYSISVYINRHNSFPSGPVVNYSKDFRKDELILLSIANKLIRGATI